MFAVRLSGLQRIGIRFYPVRAARGFVLPVKSRTSKVTMSGARGSVVPAISLCTVFGTVTMSFADSVKTQECDEFEKRSPRKKLRLTREDDQVAVVPL
jgi:hypothetical protein